MSITFRLDTSYCLLGKNSLHAMSTQQNICIYNRVQNNNNYTSSKLSCPIKVFKKFFLIFNFITLIA